ncbi:MAG: hypothetical protein HBSAPP01_13820 [Candidatus Brocadia sapporoensis]|nr:MAG: hypothetical protein HBSAPP01_13820 [Candidatus Brocadia sapporoensis]
MTNWLNDIKIEQLPAQYQDIVRHIGLENTVKLAGYYSKLGFYFSEIKPGEPFCKEYQEMAGQIGTENTLKLARYFKGELIYFAGLEEVIRQKKYEYIVQHFKGDNHKELARATHYSEQWVYEILWREQQKKRMAAKQLKLF